MIRLRLRNIKQLSRQVLINLSHSGEMLHLSFCEVHLPDNISRHTSDILLSCNEMLNVLHKHIISACK